MFSFSLDFTGVFTTASMIINNLFPVYLLPLGLSLGIGLLGYVVKAFNSVIK